MSGQARTSVSHPLRVDWVDPVAVPASAGWTGKLGMTFLPGKHSNGISGLHERDLAMDLDRLRGHWKTDTFVLLVQDDELEWTEVPQIESAMANHAIELLRFPIPDGGTPLDATAFAELLDGLHERLRDGKHVVVACRGGLGRTGTLVGCLLRDAGLSGAKAVDLTRRSRSRTIENDRQETYVKGWDGRRSA
ncbi:MAG: protein-tyrosine-phosphatase [Chloroflexota bacterium]